VILADSGPSQDRAELLRAIADNLHRGRRAPLVGLRAGVDWGDGEFDLVLCANVLEHNMA